MNNETALKRPPSNLLFFALFCVLFNVIFAYTLSIMASPYIVADLGGSNDIATYSVTFFALGNALGVPLGRALLPRIGAARFLVITLLLFTFFTWAGAIASTYLLFNAARFFQGFVSGPFYALVFYLLACLQPKEKKGLFAAVTLTIFTTGPVIGACWGGWIAYLWDWRWIFYFNIPCLLLLTAFIGVRLRGFDRSTIQKEPFDHLGYLTYFISVLCIGLATITGQELDWQRSNFIITLFTIGTLSLIFFILWEINHPHPILELKLLKKPPVLFALFNLAVLFSIYFGMVVLLALWLKLWVNYTPDWIAALLGIMALTAFFPPFFVYAKLSRHDNRIFLLLAIFFLIISSWHTMVFNVDIDFGRIATSRLLAGLGLALFLAPIFRLCFHNVTQDKMLGTLTLFQVVRALSSGLGASVYATIWQRRQVFFHDRLGSKITANSPETLEYFAKADTIGLKGEHAIAQLEYYLEREATSLALDDCFYLMAWILIGLGLTFLLTFFAKKGSFMTEDETRHSS